MAVPTSASARYPADTAPRPPDPVAAMPWNALMTPRVVASRPTNTAVAPMVASDPMPFLRSAAVRAEARWMARRTLSITSSRLSSTPASFWNWYSCSPARTTFPRWLYL